jgi:uncharacterized protein YecA (UPF0149 family)
MTDQEFEKRLRELGRNDPCSCGSGKKYKKCHLVADEEARSKALAQAAATAKASAEAQEKDDKEKQGHHPEPGIPGHKAAGPAGHPSKNLPVHHQVTTPRKAG